MTEIISIEVDD